MQMSKTLNDNPPQMISGFRFVQSSNFSLLKFSPRFAVENRTLKREL